MGAVFLRIVNMSITASWLIVAVILVRLLLRKAPKRISCVLWAFVAIRLICPFSLESALSLIPSTEVYPVDVIYNENQQISNNPYNWRTNTGIPLIDGSGSNNTILQNVSTGPVLRNNLNIIGCIWLVGIVVLLLYAIISYAKMKRSVRASILVRDNIFVCDEVKSPFILGIIKPLIYIPSSMTNPTLDYVITHEAAHIKRRDHWWKPLGFLLLAIYWFNPLSWIAYILLCRDIEMACDEKVIRDMDKGSVSEYSQALLNCSFPRRRIAACPLAFGEVGVKERVKSVLNYKKPALWIIAVAVVACIVVGVCFMTNPTDSAIGKPVFETENIARVTFYDSSPNSAETEVPNEYLTEITEWLGTFVAGKKANEVLPPGADSLFVRIEYSNGTIIENSMSTTIVDGTTYIINYDKEPQCYFDLFKSYATNTKWFDCLHGDEMVWDGRREINLDEFPGVTFRWFSGELEAVTEKETITLYTGMPIWSVYFCDLTGDGLPELCSSLSFGSGMIDNRVMIYDYANGVSYSMEDRGVTDYILRQNESDGQLYVDKTAYMGGGLLSTGRLIFKDDCLQVLWTEKLNDSIREITDPTKDPNFSYDAAVEKFYEDDNNEYFFGGIYSKHVIVQYADGSEEDISAALYSGRASISDLDRFDIRYWTEPKKSSLEDAISKAILEHYASDEPDGLIYVESHVILGKDAVSGTPLHGSDKIEDHITYYIYMHHEKYSSYGGELKAVGGIAGPVAITFRSGPEGENILEEYWEARDGSYYAKDVRDKFPAEAAELALSQVYSKELKYQNMNKAFYILNNSNSIDVKIAELLDTICSSPSFSSSTHDYIREHESEYNELVGYGKYTLQYCFSEFLKGERADLRGHIMALVCNDISTGWGEALAIDGTAPATGQGWFAIFRNNAETLAKQYSREDLEKYYPASFLFLQMSDSNFEIKE